MAFSKIKSLSELEILLADLRRQGRRIVHCHGVFDLLHIGHIRYFAQARQKGDVLVVTISPDRFVDKGPYRPAFQEQLRAEAVASLDAVDYVAINEWPTAEETLRLLRPDVYVKGSDFKDASTDPTGKLAKEEQVAKEIGASMVFTRDVVFSSTNLINRFLSTYPDNVREYIKIFKTRHDLADVLQLLDRFTGLKVLVIGDAILDEYQYCHTLGVSSKDPALALQYESHDLFAGGVLAIANHLGNFCDQVRLMTVLGAEASQEEFIRAQLATNIDPHFVYKPKAPTIVKRRFVEGYSTNKLFEVYVMDDGYLAPAQEEALCQTLLAEIDRYDLVLAADFGHGAIGAATRKVLMEHAKFLAVNTQANAGNRGFHTINRYAKSDFVSLAEGEIQLEFRDMQGDVKPMMRILARKMGCRYIAVTLGKRGCLVKNQNDRMVGVPALVEKVVDRVGSGDAFFSVTSLAACLGASPELIGFIGNVIGGQAVTIFGNQKPIDKLQTEKFITALLK